LLAPFPLFPKEQEQAITEWIPSRSIEPPGIVAVVGIQVLLDNLPVEQGRMARFDKGDDSPALPVLDGADGFLEPPGQFAFVDVAFDGRPL